jgi:hypothetical protein
MKFECTDFDADFFAELDREIAEAMIELEKDLAETEAELRRGSLRLILNLWI